MVFSPPIPWKSTWHAKKACMILLDASSGTIVRGVSLRLWHHCHLGSIVILLWLTHSFKILPSIYVPLLHLWFWYGVVSLRGSWCIWRCTSSRELFRYLYAASCRWSPAHTRSRIQVFLKTVSSMIVHSRFINGEAMVPFRPFSLQFSYSLSYVHRDIYNILFLRGVAEGIQPFLQVRLVQGVAGWSPKYVQSCSLRRISLSLGLKSAGVAPLPPCYCKLLDETVKTFAVFTRGCTFSMVKTTACCPYH